MVADNVALLGKIPQGGELKANPAEILGKKLKGGLLGVTVETDYQTIAGESVDSTELQESHQTTTVDQRMAPVSHQKRGNLPSFEVTTYDILVEEDDHGFLVDAFGNEATEADAADVVPDLDPVGNHGVPVDVGECVDAVVIDDLGSSSGIVVIVMHTHHKRVLLGQVPLTKENSPQCLAEESLTLSRDGVCSPPSARLANSVGRLLGGEGGTRRR